MTPNKYYFDKLARQKGFKNAKQRGMIYKVLKERREHKRRLLLCLQ